MTLLAPIGSDAYFSLCNAIKPLLDGLPATKFNVRDGCLTLAMDEADAREVLAQLERSEEPGAQMMADDLRSQLNSNQKHHETDRIPR